MDGRRLQNANDVVSFYESKQMEEHVAYLNARRQVSWFFHLVKSEDVNRSVTWNCKNIVRTRSLPYVALVSHRDVTLLNLRELACFCLECMDDNLDFCENKSQVQPWKLHTLEPINITQVNIHLFLSDKTLTLQIIIINYCCFLISTFFNF